MEEKQLSLLLHWSPREQGMEAGPLTNEDFSAFDITERMAVSEQSLCFEMLPDLLREGAVLYDESPKERKE